MFKLEIETENDFFGATHEDRCHAIAALLRDVARHMETTVAFGFEKTGKVRDPNGNTAGIYSLTP